MKIPKKDSAKVGKLAKRLRNLMDKLEDKYANANSRAPEVWLYATDRHELERLANETAPWWLA